MEPVGGFILGEATNDEKSMVEIVPDGEEQSTAQASPAGKAAVTSTPTPKPVATNTPTPKPTSTSTPTPEPTNTSTPTMEPTNTSTPTPNQQHQYADPGAYYQYSDPGAYYYQYSDPGAYYYQYSDARAYCDCDLLQRNRKLQQPRSLQQTEKAGHRGIRPETSSQNVESSSR